MNAGGRGSTVIVPTLQRYVAAWLGSDDSSKGDKSKGMAAAGNVAGRS